jgi:hypothetical protein
MSDNAESEVHRIKTREKNVDVRPGEKFKEASRVRQPPRPREVILKEKEEKAAARQARAEAKSLKVAGEERATRLEKEKKVLAALEDERIPRRLPVNKKGTWRNGSSFIFTTNVLQVKQPQGATDNAPELMKKRKKNDNIQNDDEDTDKGDTTKKTKMSHQARQASPVPQAVPQAKRPRSPTVSVSEKTNPSIEKPNTLTRNRVMTLTGELISEQCCKQRRR